MQESSERWRLLSGGAQVETSAAIHDAKRKEATMQSGLSRLRAMLAVAAAFLALSFSTGAASAGTTGAVGPYASQAKQAGLTGTQTRGLQNEVDRYLAQTGGKQVAANVIDLGGKHLMFVALPGETHPRDMTSGALVNHCAPAVDYGYFCAYSGLNYTGSSIPMYSCARYRIPWTANGSWINNQTTGTVAHFLDDGGVSRWNDGGAFSADGDAPWYWVHWVKNC
ncbi:hypothetical protein [Streptomyces sp. AK08-02]|uniref:hypothetical protein n=1 Tax=Streptomyces sp. AK08-02 TaxID=3028654 RepID=UPI0029B7D6F0|nr:hypothetical protein [Streptomyces sp. AK08-02]MDX3752577.1 hypothetical protein [Streptomyces sp. AK08-02]